MKLLSRVVYLRVKLELRVIKASLLLSQRSFSRIILILKTRLTFKDHVLCIECDTAYKLFYSGQQKVHCACEINFEQTCRIQEWSSNLQKHLPKHDTDKTTWLTFEFRNKTTHNNSKRKTLGESSGKHLLIFRQKNSNRRHY